MRCDLHFPMPVWFEETKLNNDIRVRFCDKIKGMDPQGRKRSNKGGWQSRDIHEGEHPEMSSLETLVNRLSKDCMLDLGYDCPPVLHNFWINRNNRYDSNDLHNHPGAIVSGVYYVKSSPDSGDLIFPRPSADSFILAGGAENRMTHFNAWAGRYTPKPGMLYFFLAHMSHYVDLNNSDQERISIAFNIGV